MFSSYSPSFSPFFLFLFCFTQFVDYYRVVLLTGGQCCAFVSSFSRLSLVFVPTTVLSHHGVGCYEFAFFIFKGGKDVMSSADHENVILLSHDMQCDVKNAFKNSFYLRQAPHKRQGQCGHTMQQDG